MKNIVWVLLLAVALFLMGSCEGAVEKTNSNVVNANAAAKPGTDMKASAIERVKKANEAWKNKDGKFFEGFLSDGFVGTSPAGRDTKAMRIKSLSESKCDVKEFTISDEDAVELDDDTVLLTWKNTADYTCDGKAGPSPTWNAGIYVKDGDEWKSAFHQFRAAADAKGESAPGRPDGESSKGIEDADAELAATLSANDKKLWEAWSKKDAKPFEEFFTENYREIGSTGRMDRAKAIKDVTEHKCEVRSLSQEDYKTVKISENLVLLIYQANLDATCDGEAAPKKSWISSLYVKSGDDWKSGFFMQTPAS